MIIFLYNNISIATENNYSKKCPNSAPRTYRSLTTGRTEDLIRLADLPPIVRPRRPIPILHRWEKNVGVYSLSLVNQSIFYVHFERRQLCFLLFFTFNLPGATHRYYNLDPFLVYRLRQEFYRVSSIRCLHHSRPLRRTVVAVCSGSVDNDNWPPPQTLAIRERQCGLNALYYYIVTANIFVTA